MKNTRVKILTTLIILGLTACGSSDQSGRTPKQEYVVKAQSLNNTLYFTGTIQPLHETAISAPFDAVIQNMQYHYGQMVTKDDEVLVLDSAELQKQYNDTLTEYLKAKDNYSISKTKFVGTQDLWNAGLLAKNNYLSEKSSVDTARVSLMQSSDKLRQMMEKMNDKSQDLSRLSISEFDKVRKALTSKHNVIHLKASDTGVLLYPPKNSEGNSERLNVGSSVKAGQVIALIGDLSGVSVEIDIPEVDIDKVHNGMKASITGVALGNETLEGEVIAVNAQATNASGTLPSFTAVVEVKNLDETQRQHIKVGMSAAIALHVENKEQLQIPIAAIRQKMGATVVNVRGKDGKIREKTITTGAAQADKVVVASGLNPNEIVVYD